MENLETYGDKACASKACEFVGKVYFSQQCFPGKQGDINRKHNFNALTK